MLRIKAYDNYGQFDELYVTQVDRLHDDFRKYKIEKPEGNWPIITHKRSDGWLQLMKKVIITLEKGE